MVLAEAEDLQTELVGQHALLDKIAQPLRGAVRGAVENLCEAIETKLHE